MLVVSEEEFDSENQPPGRGPSRRYPWAIVVVVALFVILPFLSWYGSWFGRPLSDAKLVEYLHDREKPRNAQHALTQLAALIEKRDPQVKRWYPEIVDASSNPSPEVRLTAAWVMGQDTGAEEFHAALIPMLEDSSAGVRHNAALALVRFGDARGRPELVAMLQPVVVRALVAGTADLLAEDEGMAVAAGGPLVRIKQAGGTTLEVTADEAAHVEKVSVSSGAAVEEGQELMILSPSTEQVWEGLRALYLVGQPEDIPTVQRYLRPIPGLPGRVSQQAAATLESIRARAGQQ
jgi:HEAT repeat protein